MIQNSILKVALVSLAITFISCDGTTETSPISTKPAIIFEKQGHIYLPTYDSYPCATAAKCPEGSLDYIWYYFEGLGIELDAYVTVADAGTYLCQVWEDDTRLISAYVDTSGSIGIVSLSDGHWYFISIQSQSCPFPATDDTGTLCLQ